MPDAGGASDSRAEFVNRFMAEVPYFAALGMAYRAHGHDWAELELPYDARFDGPTPGVVSNGAMFSMIDSAAGFAVFARTGKLGHATLDLRIDTLSMPAAGAAVVARISCFRVAGPVAFVRGIAHTGDSSRPVASVAGTFMLGAT